MNLSNLVRQHWAALRALLVLTVITGFAYPLLIWLVAQLPGLRDNADGSIIEVDGKPVGSSLIGQSFADDKGNPLRQYFQSRPSAAGTGNGYDPLSTGASNLGPESIVDTPGDPSLPEEKNGYKASLLTQVCKRSHDIGELEGVDGRRPFCTGAGKGAVLSVIGPRDARGNVTHPVEVISVNEPCEQFPTPFVETYLGGGVKCAKYSDAERYKLGQIVAIPGVAPANPVVPADAVTASGSGLDPHISLAYADLQIKRVANARHVSEDQVRQAVHDNQDGRTLGFLGEARVNVLELNIELNKKYPV